ncbi:hypothetical protein E8E12_009131 [Didymella heteroderae]|uniref:Uncharacterized protein n=1 Tax=Didymella heteroderae TaxID=1769908 RepID=A0A9P5C2A3_9PLEO|nr:hypothetical protein E8E12_009131 [Didymella heteroderae]
MLLDEENTCACGTSQRSHKSTKVVYIVTDTRYATAADFDEGKGMTSIDSVHTTSRAANLRARKIMFARTSPGLEPDEDKIIDEVKDGLYTGIGVGGAEKNGCYARKCEVESKPIDIEDDGSSEEDGHDGQDGEDWSMG